MKKLLFKLNRWIKQKTCNHFWTYDLIFCSPPKTHRDSKYCQRCTKSITLFRGTRGEWYAKHFPNSREATEYKTSHLTDGQADGKIEET